MHNQVVAVAPVAVRNITMRAADFDPEVARELAALTAWPKEGTGRVRERDMGFAPVKWYVKPRPPRVDESWRERAACRGMDTNLFFPDRGEAHHEADAVCAGCPVNRECREFSLYEKYGVWAGLSERDRRVVRRTIKKPVAMKPVQCGTVSGYRRHHREESKPCEGCLDAYRRYRKSVRRSRVGLRRKAA